MAKLVSRIARASSAIYRRAIGYSAALATGLVLVGLVAAPVRADRSVARKPVIGPADEVHAAASQNRTIPLTSHLPWFAPVGHRQPRRSDVPIESLGPIDREQQLLDAAVDRKLTICRGC